MKKFHAFLFTLSLFSLALIGSAATSIVVTGAAAVAFENPQIMPMVAPWLTTGLFAFVITTDYVMPKNLAFSSPIVFDKGLCRDLQKGLLEIMGSNAPELKRTPVGYLQALISDTNRSNTEVNVLDTNDGKKHILEVEYIQRGTRDDIQKTYNNGCTKDISKKIYSELVEITDVHSLKGLAFTEDQMRRICKGDMDFMVRMVAAHLDPFMVVLNETLITKQASAFGNFANGSPAVQSRQLLNVVSAADKVPNAYGEIMIHNDLSDIDGVGRPILIGEGKLRDYVRLSEIGCCNEGGVDNGRLGKFDYYDDRHVGDMLGNADDFIALMPGNVQLLTYNKYKGTYKRPFNGNYSKGTIVDPYTGLELDMRWKYDDCEEEWILTFSLWFNLWFLPQDAFAAGDDLEGVNYSQHYRATEA